MWVIILSEMLLRNKLLRNNIDVFTQLYISCLIKSNEAPQSSSNS